MPPRAAEDCSYPTSTKFSLCTHLIISQSPVLPGRYGAVAMLGDNAFQTKRPGVFQEFGALLLL